MVDTVSIVKPSRDLVSSLRHSFDLIGGFTLEGVSVVIKPNVCVARDVSGGANTSVGIVKAVIDIMLEKDEGLKISIVESDSAGKWLDDAFQNNGYTKMLQRYYDSGYDIRLVNLSREPSVVIPQRSQLFWGLHIPKMLLEPNYFISITRAKTHGLTDVTGVLKNQFGCIPRKDKMVYHNFIDRVILEINRWVRPDLCVVDAITGMEGVAEGRLRHIGALLCGYNPASVDAVLAMVMGFNPKSINHIVLASRYGLGSIQPRIVGWPIEEVSVRFRSFHYPLPSRFVGMMSRYIPEWLRPVARSIYQKIGTHSL